MRAELGMLSSDGAMDNVVTQKRLKLVVGSVDSLLDSLRKSDAPAADGSGGRPRAKSVGGRCATQREASPVPKQTPSKRLSRPRRRRRSSAATRTLISRRKSWAGPEPEPESDTAPSPVPFAEGMRWEQPSLPKVWGRALETLLPPLQRLATMSRAALPQLPLAAMQGSTAQDMSLESFLGEDVPEFPFTTPRARSPSPRTT